MKKLLLLCLLCLWQHYSFAQAPPTGFYVSVADPAYLPTVTGTQPPYTLAFEQSPLQQWAQQYQVTDFRQAYPASRLLHLRQVYLVMCNSLQALTALEALYPQKFFGVGPYYQPQPMAIISKPQKPYHSFKETTYGP